MEKKINIEIIFNKRIVYTLTTIIILIILGVGVYAWANPSIKVGHSFIELEPCSENQILQIQNGTWKCINLIGYELGFLKFKIIEIGSWNMDAYEQKDIDLEIVSKKIRSISIMIREDDKEWRIYDLNKVDGFSKEVNGGISSIGTMGQEIILLTRTRDGFFDQTLFDDSSINRGWITIGYIE